MGRFVLAAVACGLAVAALAPVAAAGRRHAPHAHTLHAHVSRGHAPRGHAAAASLASTLRAGITAAGRSSSAYAVDLTSGQVLFSENATVPRLPASVEKLYTTSTALLRFGPDATLSTRVYGTGSLSANGTWDGNLYLKGGGDPSFGSLSYDRYAYGGGATMQHLVANLLSSTPIKAVHGAIVGDESYFDSDRGTPATDNKPDSEVEGQLSALAYNRGLANAAGTAFQAHPAQFTAAAFASALKAAHVQVPGSDHVVAGVTPTSAQALASVGSPSIATLIKWTNTPSDNFFAEMLLKGIGAKFGAGGTTAAGVAVVKAEVAQQFGIDPIFNDGSGLSYTDHSTALQVEALLAKMADNADFVGSLAVAGETGTLQDEMNHTVAQGRCRGKTGTLLTVSNLVGYCTATDGDTIAFAILMNKVNPLGAHPIQDRMVEALAAYDG